MNEEAMRKHYERTPKETLINILISSREKVDKLQKRNKERKQEIERLKKENAILKQTMFDESLLINENALLKDIIKEVREYIVKNKQYAELEDYGKNGEYYIDETGLLEILDKEK